MPTAEENERFSPDPDDQPSNGASPCASAGALSDVPKEEAAQPLVEQPVQPPIAQKPRIEGRACDSRDGQHGQHGKNGKHEMDDPLRDAEQVILDLIHQRFNHNPEIMEWSLDYYQPLRAPLRELRDAVRASVAETDSARLEIERAYHQLAAQLEPTERAAENEATAAPFLTLLEAYLEQIILLARQHPAVRAVWDFQAEVIVCVV